MHVAKFWFSVGPWWCTTIHNMCDMTACCFSPAPFVATAQKTPHVTCLKCGTFNFWHMKCSDWPRFWAGKSWLHSPGLGSPTHSTRSSRLKNSPDRPSRLPSGPSSKCSSLRWFESYPNFMGFLAYLASSQRYAWSFNMMIVPQHARLSTRIRRLSEPFLPTITTKWWFLGSI